jgi:hypothetical protein
MNTRVSVSVRSVSRRSICVALAALLACVGACHTAHTPPTGHASPPRTPTPAAIARAIATKNVKALVELPEIGKRMAETIIAELNGKVDVFLAASEIEQLDRAAESKPIARGTAEEEAIEALIALGEQRPEAERKIAKVAALLKLQLTRATWTLRPCSSDAAPRTNAIFSRQNMTIKICGNQF